MVKSYYLELCYHKLFFMKSSGDLVQGQRGQAKLSFQEADRNINGCAEIFVWGGTAGYMDHTPLPGTELISTQMS